MRGCWGDKPAITDTQGKGSEGTHAEAGTGIAKAEVALMTIAAFKAGVHEHGTTTMPKTPQHQGSQKKGI